ncbi:MAG TPA: TIGR02452 family protein [Polyangia bacterium]|jgi:uncharacterized protein (TIGR02452 family)
MKTLAKSAKGTLEVIERGGYVARSGRSVDIRAAIDAAVRGTVLHHPDELDTLAARSFARSSAAPIVELTAETTAEAGRRLVQREGVARVVALNFASAKNPGGGFLSGAKAQEEDLARCSALYPCLCAQPEYYRANRACGTVLYTDHIIYSPDVPFFRDERLELLEDPFALSIITAPAPNAAAAEQQGLHIDDEIGATLARRAKKVLAVAAAHEHRTLVLGAWGCGVFRNDPAAVARTFADALAGDDLRGAFERVVFAVYDPGGRNLGAFERQLGPARL